MESCKHISVIPKDCAGSRLRCLMLTSLPAKQVSSVLNELVKPIASVTENDHWLPRGLLEPQEAKLGECEEFLTPELREELTAWWLAVTRNANTPNWDLVSTCRVGDQQGLLLIEAKAHDGELHRDGKTPGNESNDLQIQRAIREAKQGLERELEGWTISRDSHYQLSNRFAWAWKVASAGIPVVLLYLGFLEADEMKKCGRPLVSHTDWQRVVFDHSRNVVPAKAWEGKVLTKGAPLFPMVRSLSVRFEVEN